MQRIIKYISKTLYLLLLLTLFNGCAEIEPIDGKRNIDHTIIIYMAADNNLTGYVDDNIDKMRAAMNHDISINNNLILYVDKLNQKPCLLNIYNNKIDTIAVYQEMNSTDSQVFSRVIDQIIENYPSPSYGLIMWSHGSGWLHQNTLSYISSNIFGAQQRDGAYRVAERTISPISDRLREPARPILTKAFGYEQREGGTWMELSDMADELPDNRFDYILFDACSMANIEVIYALRNKSDYFIGSAYEIMANGFPYDKIIEPLCNGEYSIVCQHFYDGYNMLSGVDRTAGIALVDNHQIDSLANCFRKIVATHSEIMSEPNVEKVQRLDRYTRVVSFDMMDFLMKQLPAEDPLMMEFASQFNKAVPYRISTPMFLNMLTIKSYCGISMYVPLPQYKSVITPYFLQTEWSNFTNYGKQ